MDPTQYGYPGYNFINQPMQFGQMPSAMTQSPMLGQSFMQPQQQQQHGPLGQFAPLFGMAGMLSQRGGLGGLAPLFGIGGGLLFSHLFGKHNG